MAGKYLHEDGSGDSDAVLLQRHGVFLEIKIGYDHRFKVVAGKRCIPNLPEETVMALVDTGARITSIDRDLADRLGLPIMGQDKAITPSGVMSAQARAAHICIPEFDITVGLKITDMDMPVSEHNHFSILLGRDLLSALSLSVNGHTGQVSIKRVVPRVGGSKVPNKTNIRDGGR